MLLCQRQGADFGATKIESAHAFDEAIELLLRQLLRQRRQHRFDRSRIVAIKRKQQVLQQRRQRDLANLWLRCTRI